MTAITEPGLYDLPAEVYHADPVPTGSLSVTRAKVLLEEGGPAKFHHRATSPTPEHKPAWDVGRLVHAMVLGKGMDQIAVIPHATYRTKAAQEERDGARASGLTPVLLGDMQTAEDMAAALSSHPTAVRYLTGRPEVSMFAEHITEKGERLWLRGQLDVLAAGSHIGDYKTTRDASLDGFTRAAFRFRYHMQAAWYRWLTTQLTGERLPFVMVAQEKEPPYLVSVWEPDPQLLDMGAEDMDEAIDIYLRCTRTGKWPGYPDEIQALSAPDWALDDDIEIEV